LRGYYTANNFSINTDINTLISPTLGLAKARQQFDQAFEPPTTSLRWWTLQTPELTNRGERGT